MPPLNTVIGKHKIEAFRHFPLSCIKNVTRFRRIFGKLRYVRFGSKADACAAPAHVRFTPESGMCLCTGARPLRTKRGHCRRRSGCIRLSNNDIIDLYNRTKLGATVVVRSLVPRSLYEAWCHGRCTKLGATVVVRSLVPRSLYSDDVPCRLSADDS